MSRGKLLLAVLLVIALATLTLASTPNPTAIPLKTYTCELTIVDQQGNPITGTEFTVVLGNVTGGTVITDVTATTDGEGKITFTVVLPTYFRSTQTYNLTIYYKDRVGKWYKVAPTLTATADKPEDLAGTLVNRTITAEYWLSVKIYAQGIIKTTLPNRTDTIVGPLVFKDPETGKVLDPAVVYIYHNGSYPYKKEGEDANYVWKGTVDENGYAYYFNATIYRVEFDHDYHEKSVFHPVYVINVWWGHDTVLVANVTVTFDETNYTDAPVAELTVNCTTALVRVQLTDCEGAPIVTGETKVDVVFEIGDKPIRSGRTNFYGVAPLHGKGFLGTPYFWLPVDCSTLSTTYNIEVYYLGYLVFYKDVTVTTETDVHTPDVISGYVNSTYAPAPWGSAGEYQANLVRVVIIVKSSQKPSEALSGVKVIITGGPWTEDKPFETYTYAGGDAWAGTIDIPGVILPPYYHDGEEIKPIYAMQIVDKDGTTYMAPGGFLPAVPTDEGETYKIKAIWKDIVAKETEVTLRVCEHKYLENYILIQLELYEFKVKVVDLCEEPIPPTYTLQKLEDDTWTPYTATTKLRLKTEDNKVIVETPIKEGGYAVFTEVPPGTYTVELKWKEVWLSPVEGVPGYNVTITVDERLQDSQEAVAVMFPIKNITWYLYQWDKKEPVEGLEVTVIYKIGGGTFREVPVYTDSEGKAAFAKIPIKLVEGEAWVEAKTSEYTKYIRPKDVGLLVFKKDLNEYGDAIRAKECLFEVEEPVEIFSFYVSALDCKETILKGVKLYDKSKDRYLEFNVTILLDDEAGSFAGVYYDFRIINITNPYDAEAKFFYNSTQKDIYKPHLFVAGATYKFMVFYGGTLVYNYTFTLPKPGESVVYYVDETKKDKPVKPAEELETASHKVVIFEGAPSWKELGVEETTEKPELKLVTWVVPVELYTVSMKGKYGVASVRVEIKLVDILNVSFTADPSMYAELADDGESTWQTYAVDLYLYGVTGDDAKLVLRFPVWVPTHNEWAFKYHFNGIRFGTKVEEVLVIGSKDLGTPGFLVDATKIINWNGTVYGETSAEYYPGGGWSWNITTWCGTWTKLPTALMECFEVDVQGPDKTGKYSSIPYKTVEVYLEDVYITKKYEPEAKPVHFDTKAKGSTTLPDGTTLPVVLPGEPEAYYIKIFSYKLKTYQNFDHILENYNGLKTEDVFQLETLTKTIYYFNESNNCGTEDIVMKWNAIWIKVLDWAGQPLAKMTVFVYPTTGAGTMPYAFGTTDSDGVAVIYVAGKDEEGKPKEYYVDIYWRDTYFLEKAGIIEKSINIYASAHDEEYPDNRRYVAGEYREVKVYVYKGVLKLLKADGTPLSAEALKKIKVTIIWPDKVETVMTGLTSPTVNIVLNSKTVTKWPHDYSKNYNPESPVEQPQTPPGAYKIIVTWEGVSEPIYEGTITIERGKYETPLVIVEVPTAVYDLAFKLTSPFGTPLAGAKLTVEVPGYDKPLVVGTDAEGSVTLLEVPFGKATIKEIVWKGVKLEGEPEHTVDTTTAAVKVEKIGKLTVKITGALGQPDTETVEIKGPIEKVVKVVGSYTEEVPAGSYKVAGKTVTVEPGKETTVALSTGRIYGISTGQLFIIIGAIILGIAILIVVTTYLIEKIRAKKLRAIISTAPSK